MIRSRIFAIALLLSLHIFPVAAQQPNTTAVERIATLSGHTKSILEINFSTSGEIPAASSSEGTVRLWNVVSGESLGMIAAQKSAEISKLSWSGDGRKLAISPSDGQLLATRSEDKKSVLLWRLTR